MRVGIVGAGLAGLAAATELMKSGHQVEVFEADGRPGGRTRTDVVDGYRLDRGFQTLLTSYPECGQLLDYDRLDLKTFEPGVLLRIDDEFHRFSDPFNDPAQLASTLNAPIGTTRDKARLMRFLRTASRGSVDSIWRGVGTTAIYKLESDRFSSTMIDRFFRPLVAASTFEPELQTSSRALRFMFRMMAAGDKAIPAKGMGAIPDLLAAGLADDVIHYGARVEAVTSTTIAIKDGDEHSFDAVIVATDADESARLAGTDERGWNSVTTVWYSCDEAPITDPILCLNGNGVSPINSLAPMSIVSSDYAPADKHLLAVSSPSLDPDLPDAMSKALRDWFGPKASTFAEIRVDQIERAQPKQLPGHDARAPLEVDGLWVAGVHRRDVSLDGAIGSGRAVARAIAAR